MKLIGRKLIKIYFYCFLLFFSFNIQASVLKTNHSCTQQSKNTNKVSKANETNQNHSQNCSQNCFLTCFSICSSACDNCFSQQISIAYSSIFIDSYLLKHSHKFISNLDLNNPIYLIFHPPK